MEYLVIGAGGTGGCIAGYMHKAGKDVTLIARGKHLTAIKKEGLTIKRPKDILNLKVNAVAEEDYKGKADVIFLCVKYFSLEDTYALVKRASHKNTIVIPVLNIYGTGEKMSEVIQGIDILNGCIYIASEIESSGVLKQCGEIFRIVYGRLDGNTEDERLQKIKNDILDSGIDAILSSDIRKDTMKKFSLVSCMGAAGSYFNAQASDFKKSGKERDTFISCINEIIQLSRAMGITLDDTIVETNLAIMENLGDEVTTSMQKDLKKGGHSEKDGLITEVIRLGEKYQIEIPTYKMIANKIK